jgi:hypothetical protein
VFSWNEQAIVPDGSVNMAAIGRDGTATAGQEFNGTVAIFQDYGQTGSVGDYTAQIDWGDGQTSTGQVVDNGDGTFGVTGVHTFLQAGFYSVQVQILDGSEGDTVTAGGTATVNPGSDPLPPYLRQVAGDLTHSPEYYANVITAAYQQYVKRAPDGAGLAYWVDQMLNHGLTDERLEASFLGSVEYVRDHGGNGAGWVEGMYEDLLGRAADASGLAFWTDALAHGASPAAIAYGFAASPEREAQRVAADYQRYLGRSPDAAGLNYWVDEFVNHGQTNEDLVAGFVGSPEYFQVQGSTDRGWVLAAYQAILNRQPSGTEMNWWLEILEGRR